MRPEAAQAAGAKDKKAPTSLADVTRGEFEALADPNKDGKVTKEEISGVSKKFGEEEGLPLPDNEQLDFSLRLYDLNQDGDLATEELLR